MRPKRRHPGQGRRFRSDLLEKISHIHPVIPFLVWFPVAGVSFVLGDRAGIPLGTSAVLVVSGWLVWTLAEYALHRWVFHWEPANPWLAQKMRPIHKVHHEIVEWDRIVAHPMYTLPLGLAFFAVFRLALGPWALPLFTGFVLGYLLYELIHFRTHFGRARTRLARRLRSRHLQHHHACPARWFGVSTAFWDYVFRTHVPRGTKPIRLGELDAAR